MQTAVLVGLVLALTGCASLEPRWLLRALPGSYPDVVYYFPVREPLLALTIDDGPDPTATAELLDVLHEHGARATFFLLSDNVAGNEALVRRMVDEGHELGNHLTRDEVSADLEPAAFATELARAHSVLSGYADVHWFRPGSAWFNASMRDALAPYDFRLVEASMPPLDARLPWPGFVAGYIRATARPGSILVLHTNKARGPRTVAVVRRIVPALTARGFRFVTLSALDRAAASSAQTPLPSDG